MARISYAMISKAGSRSCNEDSVKMIHEGRTWVFALADGLGGEGCGDMASSIAVESVLEDPDLVHEEGYLDQAFASAQSCVLVAQKESPAAAQMCTTLVLLRVQGGKGQWGHIGDSRLYHFHGWSLKNQTKDHSVPQMLVDMGEIRTGEIRFHPDRSRLLKAVGKPWEGKPYTLSPVCPVRKGDNFLLCSDGFWELITEREMRKCLVFSETAKVWLQRMTEIVEKRGHGKDMDNYSAICVRVR